MSVVKRLAGQAAFFLIGNVFTLLVGFVFQVYLAKQLGAAGLGVFGLLESGVGVVTTLLGFGIAQTVMRYIPTHVRNHEIGEVRTLIHKGFIYLGLSGVGGILLVLLILPMIKNQWATLQGYELEIIVMSLMIPLGMLVFLGTQILRGFFDVLHIVIGSSFMQLTLKVIVTVLMFKAGMHLLGYIWAVVISTCFALSWMLFGIRRHLRALSATVAIAPGILPEWKNYAKVMYSNSLLGFWFAPLDRFLVGIFLGVNAVGVLMVAKMIYILPGVFLQMFLAIVAPMLSSAHAAGQSDEILRIYQLCTDWLVRISFPLIIFLLFFAAPILKLFGAEFAEEGVLLLRMLLLAQLFSLACGPVGNILNMCGLERSMFKINLINVMASAVILLILVPLWGINGVGVSVLVGTLYSNLAAIYVARKKMGIKWWSEKVKRWIVPSIFSVVSLIFIYANLTSINASVLISVLIIIYIAFFFAQFACYGVDNDDREVFEMLMNRMKISHKKIPNQLDR